MHGSKISQLPLLMIEFKIEHGGVESFLKCMCIVIYIQFI